MPISDFAIGAANILGGIFFHALVNGKISRTEARLAFWSNWRSRYPTFSQYGPPFLVAFGIVRIALGALA